MSKQYKDIKKLICYLCGEEFTDRYRLEDSKGQPVICPYCYGDDCLVDEGEQNKMITFTCNIDTTSREDLDNILFDIGEAIKGGRNGEDITDRALGIFYTVKEEITEEISEEISYNNKGGDGHYD